MILKSSCIFLGIFKGDSLSTEFSTIVSFFLKIRDLFLYSSKDSNFNGNLLSSHYGNNTSVTYTYDELDRIKTLSKNNKTYKYHYNNLNNVSKIQTTSYTDTETYKYYYDLAERLSRYEVNSGSIEYDYDLNNNVTKKKYQQNGLNGEITYTYDEDDSIIKVAFDNQEVNFNYDSLGRLSNKNINNHLPVEYAYYSNGNKTSMILKSMKIDNDLYEYIYDELYNITDIYINGDIQNHYEYDNFNELIEDDNYILNKTYKFTYDTNGNILTKEEYELNTSTLIKTDTYEYSNLNWQDQLTKFNNTNITYDEIGNPITIGNTNLIWWGRELQRYQSNILDITYFYDKEGIRRRKIVNGVETSYFIENSNIIFEVTNGNVLYYLRTDEHDLIGFKYNNETYYYKKNYQGDIIGIYNSNYELLCTYEYDSYGSIVSIKDALGQAIEDANHIANINPYRYRSYYYDKETKLYYLNSRYYNPLWGRFINADGIIGTSESYLGYNLYAYCENNPIVQIDSEGNFALALAIIGGISAIAALAIATMAPRVMSPTTGAIAKRIETVHDIKKTKEKEAEKEIEKATAKSKSAAVSRYEKNKKPCTTATINPNTNNVERGYRLTIDQSVKQVEYGRNVMCDSEIYAFQVAVKFPGFVSDPPHGGEGYYPHFHPKRNSHVHIWYLVK